MYYVYVLPSQKTGRRYVGSCQKLDDRVRRHKAGQSKATTLESHGHCFTPKHFPPAPKPLAREQYSDTGLGRDELNLL